MNNKNDPMALGIPNINFSCETNIEKEKFLEQRLHRGFDDSETWCLATTIAQFIKPRLEVLRDLKKGHPAEVSSAEEWQDIIGKMIEAFTLIAEKNSWMWENDEEALVKEGLRLFTEYYFNLWW